MRTRWTVLVVGFALLAPACGSESADSTAPVSTTTVAAGPSTTAEPLDTSGESTTSAVTPTTEAAPPTTTASNVIYAEDPGPTLLRVSGVSADSSLNVRSAPGVEAERVGAFAAETWHIEPTQRVATVDGELWRELILPSGSTGWAHSDYLAETATTCLADPEPTGAVLFENRGTGDLDNDGLEDRATQIGYSEGAIVVHVEFGNGAETWIEMGTLFSTEFPDRGSHGLSVYDLNGDGYHEMAYVAGGERGHDTTFFGFDECDLVGYGEGSMFTIWSSSSTRLHFACINPGTADVEVHQLTGRMNDAGGFDWTVRPTTFDPTTGFTVQADYRLADLGIYTEECSRDYD